MTGEYTATGTQVTSIKNGRLYNLGVAYSLRNTGVPTSLVDAQLAASSTSSIRALGGTTIFISGVGLAWATDVYIGKDDAAPLSEADLADTTKFAKATIVNRGEDENLLEVLTPVLPTKFQSDTTTKLDIVVVLPPGPDTLAKQSAKRLIPINNALNVLPKQRIPWGGLLAGVLAAILGLAAGGGDGGGGGGGCFIATAAYGTPMAPEIDTLRAFRDAYLLSNPVGTAFADLYYHVSPAIADVIAKSPVLAALVRMVLVPVIFLAKLVLAMPGVSAVLGAMSFAALWLRFFKRTGRKA